VAINSVLQRSKLHFFHTTIARVRSAIKVLAEMRVRPVLAWIPSHSDIPLNDKVDSLAKIAIQNLPPVQNNTIAFGTGKNMILKQVVLSWQLCWNRSTTGRSTHELIPKVDTKMIFPKNRCVSISYVRLLLNDTTLKNHQHRLGLSVTKVCDCNQGIEDEYHFLFECCRYKEIRKQLIHVVQNSWSEAGLTGSPTWSVKLLLMPSCLDIFTNKQCQSFYQQLLSLSPSLAAVFRIECFSSNSYSKKRFQNLMHRPHRHLDKTNAYVPTVTVNILRQCSASAVHNCRQLMHCLL